MRRVRFGLALALLLVVSAACMNEATPTPALPTATLPPLATFTPRFTATPVPSVTPRPTATETASPSPIPPSPSDSPTPSPTSPVIGQISSASEAINLREGPGITYDIIQGVLNNTELIILASNEDQTWYNVRLEDGTEGWLAANLVFLPPTPTSPPTSTEPGVVVEISGTPLATALLGGQPVTATPSFTPTSSEADGPTGAPTRRTPGTVTATPSVTPTRRPSGLIPTVTPGITPSGTVTLNPNASPTPATPRFNGEALPVRSGYDVLAYCVQFNEVPPPLSEGTTIDVFWGWIASTQDYLQQHVNNVIYEVSLDGRLLNNWRQYAAPVSQEADGNWSIYWYVPIAEPLEAGIHEIRFRATWRSPIFDGQQQFGPGTPNEEETGNCIFEIR